jgi:hypothetical protein
MIAGRTLSQIMIAAPGIDEATVTA